MSLLAMLLNRRRPSAGAEGVQDPPSGFISYIKNPPPLEGDPVARVKFLQDTVHPDLGEVKKGEVHRVDREYVAHYERLGIAEETDDDLTSRNTGDQ